MAQVHRIPPLNLRRISALPPNDVTKIVPAGGLPSLAGDHIFRHGRPRGNHKCVHIMPALVEVFRQVCSQELDGFGGFFMASVRQKPTGWLWGLPFRGHLDEAVGDDFGGGGRAELAQCDEFRLG